MECPECKKGKIRVIIGLICSCGHNMLGCDNIECNSMFAVDCGAPFDGSKLPPEYPVKLEGVKDLNEMTHKMIADSPLLEDFKAELAKKE